MGRYGGTAGKRLQKIREEKAKKQKHRCYWCKEPFTETLKPTADHLLPHALGGRVSGENIVASCFPCNQSRGVVISKRFNTVYRRNYLKMKKGKNASYDFSKFDNYEVQPCKEFTDTGYGREIETPFTYTEQVEEKDAEFFTLYGHYSEASGLVGVEALGDYVSRTLAEQALERIKRAEYDYAPVIREAINRPWASEERTKNEIINLIKNSLLLESAAVPLKALKEAV